MAGILPKTNFGKHRCFRKAAAKILAVGRDKKTCQISRIGHPRQARVLNFITIRSAHR